MRDLALTLDPALGRRAGLERALRDAIRAGRLVPGSVLPSSRGLAEDLAFSRSTVVAVYEQLVAEGYLDSQQGLGTRVATLRIPQPERVSSAQRTQRFSSDFRPGEPDTSTFPRQRWLRSGRRALAEATDELLGYPDPRGCYQLREALSEYLARTRAVVATPEAVSVFAGFGASIGFLGELFLHLGIKRVGVEDPALSVVHEILHLVGVAPVPIPVNEEGIDVCALESSGVRAVFTTPAHQYPLGITMSPGRRIALIKWARRHQGWIVEDDYDGEFRYDRHPLGSLQGLDPSRVIYAGTASKSLIPGLRQSWLVVPADLRRKLGAIKHLRGATSAIEQLTLADFIQQGELDRHLRAARSMYSERQHQLVAALSDNVGWIDVEAQAAGLHMTVRLPDDLDEHVLIRQAGDNGIGLMSLASHYVASGAGPGLVLGYSRPATHEYAYALSHLVAFLQTCRPVS